jgi:hypothetical protein
MRTVDQLDQAPLAEEVIALGIGPSVSFGFSQKHSVSSIALMSTNGMVRSTHGRAKDATEI